MVETAEQLIFKGKHREALAHLKELSAQSLDIIEDLKCRKLISECKRLMGEFSEALKLSQQLIDDSSLLSDSYWVQIDAMIQKSHSLLQLDRYDESLEITEQISGLLYPRETLVREAKLLRLQGWAKLRQGRTDEALECALKAMDIGEKLEDQNIIAYSCQLYGSIYQSNHDFDRALEYNKRGLKIREDQGNIQLAHDLHNNIGVLYTDSGELDSALWHYEKALKIGDDKSNVFAVLLGNIGFVYYLKGELEKALEYSEKALFTNRKEGYQLGIANSLATIGRIYRELGEFDKAFNFLEQGLELHKEIGMEPHVFEDIFELVVTAIESSSTERADQYLVQLREVEKKLDIPWIEGALDLAEAIVLMTRGPSYDCVKIKELLCKVAYQETMGSRFRIRALLNLCGLLMEQLKESGDSKFLQEVREHVRVLSRIAQDQSSFWIHAESIVLESKLALLGMDFREASRLLTRAQRIAFEKGLGRLAIKISNEHDRLLDEESTWNELEQEPLLTERIELAKIDKQVSEMFRRGLVEESELGEEEPIMVMLLNLGGLCIYDKNFTSATDINKDVIAGFLNAIQNFSDEFFSQALDRIRLESYTLLMRIEGSFTYCYVFKGQSYSALQKLSKFIDTASQISSVWESLLESTATGQIISSDVQASLDSLLEEVFMNNCSKI